MPKRSLKEPPKFRERDLYSMAKRLMAAVALLGAVQTTTLALAEPSYSPAGDAALTQSAAAPDRQGAQEPLPPPLSEKETKSTDVDRLNGDYLKGYFTDTGRMITSPMQWEGQDWMRLGIVLGGTSALFLADKEIRNFAQSNQSGVASRFASVGNFIGDPINIYPAIGAFYLYGSLADDGKARRVSLLALESLTISNVFQAGIKTVAGRHRPDLGHSPSTWDGPTSSDSNSSFSSGHTSAAFSVATVVAEEYKHKPYAAPVAYGLASLTALARIYSDRHWSSDVFFGAALGHFVSKAVLNYHKEDKKVSRVSILPQVGKEMTGVTVNYKF